MTNQHDKPRVLASDLDGTLIPLNGSQENIDDLARLRDQLAAQQVILAFVTGRHLASVENAIDRFSLPFPDWVVCDVGTTIVRRTGEDQFEVDQHYIDHLRSICHAVSLDHVTQRILTKLNSAVEKDHWQLRLQEDEKQGRFKLSFYSAGDQLAEVSSFIKRQLHELDAPYNVIASTDPFTGDGLIDLLPRGVSKAYALQWWSEHRVADGDDLVFAGDSGNDMAALIAGYRTIVVGNAERKLADQVATAHRQRGWDGRLYLADRPATSGVLDGCYWFELFG